MRFIFLVLFSAIAANQVQAQKMYEYADKKFRYSVKVDSANDQCSVKSISIYNLSDKKLVQQIIPAENTFYCTMEKDQILTIEDVNFDGLYDIRIIQFLPAGPNIPYFYWFFDAKTGRFKADKRLEDVVSPEFDHQKKLIHSGWRDGCCDHGNSIYKFIGEKLIKIEEVEIATDMKHEGYQIFTRKKLVKGKWLVVEKKKEKITVEK